MAVLLEKALKSLIFRNFSFGISLMLRILPGSTCPNR